MFSFLHITQHTPKTTGSVPRIFLIANIFRILFFITVLAFGFIFSIHTTHAFTVNIYPDSQHALDEGTETLSEITSNNSAVDPYTLSAINAGDGTYTVDKGDVMHFDTFDTSAIPASAVITGAVLHFEYGAEEGYSPTTNYVRYLNASSVLTNTDKNPTGITSFSGDLAYDIYANDSTAVDTITELTNMDIEFTSPDAGGADAVHFDYLYIILR